jgi:hypothetical protein
MPAKLRLAVDPADLAVALSEMSPVDATQYLIAVTEHLNECDDAYKSALAYQLLKVLKACNPGGD